MQIMSILYSFWFIQNSFSTANTYIVKKNHDVHIQGKIIHCLKVWKNK